MQRVVMGIVDTPMQAQAAVDRLSSVGFSAEDVSVMFSDKHGTHDFGFEQHTKAPEGAVLGAAFGAVLGSLFGMAAGIGVVVIPGLGALVASGPVLSALSGASVGGALLGIVGALAGARVPEIEAKHYEGKLRTGSILVAVHAGDRASVSRARDVLRQVAASHVRATSEAAVPTHARA